MTTTRKLNKVNDKGESEVRSSLDFESDVVTVLNEISHKLSILIKYESLLHKVDLEEDL